MIDLEQTAANMFTDIIAERDHDRDSIDIDAIRDAISEQSFETAENVCIYFSACSEIIDRYENDSRADIESADELGAVYKPSEYLNAMRDFALGIARSIIAAEAYELADELETAIDKLCSAVFSKADVGHINVRDIRLSADCVHGWSAHDYETDNGACFWISRQLDGCNAVAMPSAGIWLSYTWEPAAEHCPAVCPIN